MEDNSSDVLQRIRSTLACQLVKACNLTDDVNSTCVVNPNSSYLCYCPFNNTGYICDSEDSDLDWSFLFVLIFIVAGGVGNILVCLAVLLDKKLQNVTNYFLLSLAIADLLVSLFVMPLGAIPGLLGRWPFGISWCNVYVTCDVLACSSSIMHMCFISLGRYLGIRNPFRTRHSVTKKTVIFRITMAWFLAMLVSSSITILGIVNPENIMPTPDKCVINNRAFFVFGSLIAFYIPMVVMITTYILTIQLLKKKTKFAAEAKASKFRRSGGKTDQEIDGNITTISQAHNFWRISSGSQEGNRGSLKMSSQSSYYENEGGGAKKEKSTQTPDSIAKETKKCKLKWLKFEVNSVPSNFPTFRVITSRVRRRDCEYNSVASEQKASKVLGVVFFTFVFCWTPFFILNIIFAACVDCEVSEHIVVVCLWLGYVSSTINPIIYTVFNRSFRATFKRLLLCKCHRSTRLNRYRMESHGKGTSNLCNSSSLPLAISLQGTPLLRHSSERHSHKVCNNSCRILEETSSSQSGHNF